MVACSTSSDNRAPMVNVNVELRNEAVRRFLAAFEDDDDTFRQTLHPGIEWYPIEENRVALHGVEAAVRNRNAWLDTWDEHRLDVDEVVEEGDDVVALIHIAARGRGQRGYGRRPVLRPGQGARGQGGLHLRPRRQDSRAPSRRGSGSLELTLVDAKPRVADDPRPSDPLAPRVASPDACALDEEDASRDGRHGLCKIAHSDSEHDVDETGRGC
jgi:hypothetical protein